MNLNANIGSKISMKSYGFNLKAEVYLKQLGLGLRGGYYRTYGEHPDNSDIGYDIIDDDDLNDCSNVLGSTGDKLFDKEVRIPPEIV